MPSGNEPLSVGGLAAALSVSGGGSRHLTSAR